MQKSNIFTFKKKKKGIVFVFVFKKKNKRFKSLWDLKFNKRTRKEIFFWYSIF